MYMCHRVFLLLLSLGSRCSHALPAVPEASLIPRNLTFAQRSLAAAKTGETMSILEASLRRPGCHTLLASDGTACSFDGLPFAECGAIDKCPRYWQGCGPSRYSPPPPPPPPCYAEHECSHDLDCGIGGKCDGLIMGRCKCPNPCEPYPMCLYQNTPSSVHTAKEASSPVALPWPWAKSPPPPSPSEVPAPPEAPSCHNLDTSICNFNMCRGDHGCIDRNVCSNIKCAACKQCVNRPPPPSPGPPPLPPASPLPSSPPPPPPRSPPPPGCSDNAHNAGYDQCVTDPDCSWYGLDQPNCGCREGELGCQGCSDETTYDGCMRSTQCEWLSPVKPACGAKSGRSANCAQWAVLATSPQFGEAYDRCVTSDDCEWLGGDHTKPRCGCKPGSGNDCHCGQITGYDQCKRHHLCNQHWPENFCVTDDHCGPLQSCNDGCAASEIGYNPVTKKTAKDRSKCRLYEGRCGGVWNCAAPGQHCKGHGWSGLYGAGSNCCAGEALKCVASDIFPKDTTHGTCQKDKAATILAGILEALLFLVPIAGEIDWAAAGTSFMRFWESEAVNAWEVDEVIAYNPASLQEAYDAYGAQVPMEPRLWDVRPRVIKDVSAYRFGSFATDTQEASLSMIMEEDMEKLLLGVHAMDEQAERAMIIDDYFLRSSSPNPALSDFEQEILSDPDIKTHDFLPETSSFLDKPYGELEQVSLIPGPDVSLASESAQSVLSDLRETLQRIIDDDFFFGR